MTSLRRRALLGSMLATPLVGLAARRLSHCDVLIRGGTLYDGTGGAAVEADLAIIGDRIAGFGALARLKEMTPPGMKAVIHLTLTDDHPYAQAFVIIEALPET